MTRKMTASLTIDREHRGLAAAYALCALAILALLVTHPSERAGSLAEFLTHAAQNRIRDGLVHGGFIVTLGALVVCFVFLSRCLGSARAPVVIALVAFCIGSGALMGSMILDGFATPAIAARFAGTDSADNLLTARASLVLLGTLVRFLMPMGLLFQSVAMFSWSLLIVRSQGLRRGVGAYGLIAAPVLALTLLVAPAPLMTHALLGAIVLQAIWYLALSAVLLNPGSRTPLSVE